MRSRQELGHGKGCGFHSKKTTNHWREGEEGHVIQSIILKIILDAMSRMADETEQRHWAILL